MRLMTYSGLLAANNVSNDAYKQLLRNVRKIVRILLHVAGGICIIFMQIFCIIKMCRACYGCQSCRDQL